MHWPYAERTGDCSVTGTQILAALQSLGRHIAHMRPRALLDLLSQNFRIYTFKSPPDDTLATGRLLINGIRLCLLGLLQTDVSIGEVVGEGGTQSVLNQLLISTFWWLKRLLFNFFSPQQLLF